MSGVSRAIGPTATACRRPRSNRARVLRYSLPIAEGAGRERGSVRCVASDRETWGILPACLTEAIPDGVLVGGSASSTDYSPRGYTLSHTRWPADNDGQGAECDQSSNVTITSGCALALGQESVQSSISHFASPS
jgi:hypothetical protein